MPDILAVIWHDMVPLSLHCASADEAINKAREMHARALAAGVTLHRLRAVRLTTDDALVILWEATDGRTN